MIEFNYDRFRELRNDSLHFYALCRECEHRLDIELSEKDFDDLFDIYMDSDTTSFDSDCDECLTFLKDKYAKYELADYLHPFEWRDYKKELDSYSIEEYVDILIDYLDNDNGLDEQTIDDLNLILEKYDCYNYLIDKYRWFEFDE